MLVADEDAFLDSARQALLALRSDRPWNERARLAVVRAYGLLLYRGLWRREERAAQELWLACYRLALNRGWSPDDAEEVAQETIARVLDKLDSLRTPESVIVWATMICRTVQLERAKQRAAELPPPQPDEETTGAAEPAGPVDVAASVEQDLVFRDLADLLRSKLDNPLERAVLMRIVLFGDHPRDVARDLGLPLHRARVAKHRALKRLHADDETVRRLRELIGDWDARAARSEGEDHAE